MRRTSLLSLVVATIALAALEALGQNEWVDDVGLLHISAPRTLARVAAPLSAVTLKIILVEFSDVKHRTLPRAYTGEDFENLLLSSGTYVSPHTKSPDGDDVFGSVGDYYTKMSNGKLSITGNLVNAIDSSGTPIWISLPRKKSHYQSFSCSSTPVFADVDSAATAAGLDVFRDDQSGIFLVVIYAGNAYLSGGGLNPEVSFAYDAYLMSERQGRPYGQENPTDRFSQIGIHCHEIGHLLGLGHSTSSRAELMDAGYANGPERVGGAPAPLDPGSRFKLGWMTSRLVTAQEVDTLRYSLSEPMVYRINSKGLNDFFLFELRRFDGSMIIGTTSVPDYNNSAFFPPSWPHGVLRQGVLAWRYTSGTIFFANDHGLIYASGRLGHSYPENIPSETDDGVPFPGVANVRVLSPWSDARSPRGSTAGHNNLFVPSTSPALNVGMEVLANDPDSGFVVVKFYAYRPEDAAPAKPEMLGGLVVDSHLRVAWSLNREPDLALRPYRVYARYIGSDGNVLQPWILKSATDSTFYDDSQFPQCSLATYRISAVDTQGRESVFSSEASIAVSGLSGVPRIQDGGRKVSSPILELNFPNPFNPKTVIRCQWPVVSNVRLVVYDILGREVATLLNERKAPGKYEFEFDGSALTSGVYFCRLTAGEYVETRKMVLLK